MKNKPIDKIQGFSKLRKGWKCKGCGRFCEDEHECYSHLKELKLERRSKGYCC